jgi:hypothetical protein
MSTMRTEYEDDMYEYYEYYGDSMSTICTV